MKGQITKKCIAFGKKYRYPCLVLLLGLVLLLIPTGENDDGEPVKSEVQSSAEGEFALEEFTREAEELLSGISGAGPVRLLLTLDTDGMGTFLSDESSRQDESGHERETQTVLVEKDGAETPVTVSRTYPVFRGAVAICPGGENSQVILSIKEAISSLTGLGMDKITVLKTD